MFDFKGFINITPLKDNGDMKLSPVGELSAHSATYSRDKTYFERPNQQVELVGFTSKKDGAKVTPAAVYTNHILELAQWVYSNAINGTITNDQEAFQRLLVGRYETEISKAFSGPMIEAKGNWFPEWISWKLDHDEDNSIKIFFADQAFRDGYKDYEIVIVPPIEPVDTFQGIRSVVEEAMKTFTLPTHHEKAIDKSGGVPYTYLLSHTYQWHDREDSTSTMPTDWSVIIWGAAGANPSHIKQAYREQILANSGHPYADWVKVFPEIFTTTMFTIVPGWSIRGIPNLEEVGALYSPILPYDFIQEVAEHFADSAASGDSSNNNGLPAQEVTTLPSLYKSLNTVCVAGNENREEIRSIYDAIKDYALISASSPDIGRVSKETTEWIRLFLATLIAAEEYHVTAPTHEIANMVDEHNPNIEYYVFEHQNVEYRVVSRLCDWRAEPES